MTPGYENSLAMSTSGMPNQYQEAESIRHHFENQRQHPIGHFQPHIHVNVNHTQQQPTTNQQTLVNSGQQQQQIDENMYYINHQQQQQQQQPLNNRTSIFLSTQSPYQQQQNEPQSNLSTMINSVETKSVIESSETKPNRNDENNEKQHQELKSSGEVVEYNDETVEEKDQIVETESYRDMSLLAAKTETEDKELQSKNMIDKDEANISQTSPKDSAKNEQQEQPEKTNISYSNPENDSSSSSQDDNLENKVEGLTILKKSKLNEAVLSDVNSNRKESMLKVEQKVQENVSGGNDLVKS